MAVRFARLLYGFLALALWAAAGWTAFQLIERMAPSRAAIAGALALAALIVTVITAKMREKPERGTAETLAILSFFAVVGGVGAAFAAEATQANAASNCLSSMDDLARVALLYAENNDGFLPLADSWQDAMAPELREGTKCRSAETPESYAMNSWASGGRLADIPEPDRAVLFFEAAPWRGNAAGGAEWFFARHRGVGYIAFANGTTRKVSQAEAADLLWRWPWPIEADPLDQSQNPNLPPQ
jgi:hypothetical protein